MSALVEVERRVFTKKTQEESIEKRYFNTNKPRGEVARIEHAIRSHWSVENSLHWTLDVVFDEDRSRKRVGNACQLLDTMPDGCVDLVLTDPPYGTTAAHWDDRIDYEILFSKLWRVLKPNGALLKFSQMPLAARLSCMQSKTFRYQWVREKANAVGMPNANKRLLRAHELILVFYRKLPTYNRIPLESQKGKP